MSAIDALRRNLLKMAGMIGILSSAPRVQSAERSLRLPFAPGPSKAAALAQEAVESIRDVYGVERDYAPQSLQHIDQIVLGFRDEALGFGDIGETIFSFGCCVGEVIVRNLGARWEMPNDVEQNAGLRLMGVRLVSGRS